MTGRVARLLLLAMLTAAPAHAQTVPEIPFNSVPSPLKLPPDLYLGEVAGVAMDASKHIYVFTRGNTTVLPMPRRPRNCWN